MSHTKGEWETLGRTIQVGNRNIASIWAKKRRGESDANARLIAAAPNLLEACEKAKDMMNKCARVFLGMGETPDPEDMANAIVDIEAAIAKAKKG